MDFVSPSQNPGPAVKKSRRHRRHSPASYTWFKSFTDIGKALGIRLLAAEAVHPGSNLYRYR